MSTFRELYSDFQDTAKLYTEKMDNTEVTFMRLITRAAQEFQLETELGFNPKIVIVPKSMGFWFYIYQTRRDFLDDNPLYSSSFSITNVKDFLESEIKHISDIKGKDFTIEELLPKFMIIKSDINRPY